MRIQLAARIAAEEVPLPLLPPQAQITTEGFLIDAATSEDINPI
jgi:hypothetical protein